jgi:predicted metal-binding protein
VSLLICRTCPRYDPRRTGRFSNDLSAALPTTSDVHLRFVPCLGGCPDHGVAAVDAPGKARVRFTGLDAGHADALLAAARAHAACGSGEPGDWQVPEELAARLSAVTPKRTGAG